MSKASELGKKGEVIAADYLSEKGFEIVEKNYRFDKAEIDIICRNKNTLVFAEVKTREYDFINDPALLVTKRKQKQIIKAADAYLKTLAYEPNCRFDIIYIVLEGKKHRMQHFEDAFYPAL